MNYCNKSNVDIVFLDIELGNDNGIQLSRKIKEINYNTLIIFISGYDNYYGDMVQAEPFRFMPKPLTSSEEIHKIVTLAYNRVVKVRDKTYSDVFYKYNFKGIVYKINLSNIMYFCSMHRKIYIKFNNRTEDSFYYKLDELEAELSKISSDFIRISKSYLINKVYIDSVSMSVVTIGNDTRMTQKCVKI